MTPHSPEFDAVSTHFHGAGNPNSILKNTVLNIRELSLFLESTGCTKHWSAVCVFPQYFPVKTTTTPLSGVPHRVLCDSALLCVHGLSKLQQTRPLKHKTHKHTHRTVWSLILWLAAQNNDGCSIAMAIILSCTMTSRPPHCPVILQIHNT